MPTIEDVARKAVAAVGADTSYTLVADWVTERYRELANRVGRMRHLRRVGQVQVPAPITAGTVTATLGSRVITGNSTAQAAWSPDVRGRWIRVSVAWYRVAEWSASGLLLDTPYTEHTASAVSYNLVSRYVTLDKRARHFTSFTHPRRRLPLQLVPYEWLMESYPNRQNVGPGPMFVAEVPTELTLDGAECKTVEIYPYSSSPETLNYLYWIEPPRLEPGDQLPQGVDEHILKEGVLIDVMRYEMAKALRMGQMEVAATWRNDYRAQRSVWEDKIKEAIRADRGPDDAVSTLELPGTMGSLEGYTPDAHTYVYDNWPR
jgi:hypothetical protein